MQDEEARKRQLSGLTPFVKGDGRGGRKPGMIGGRAKAIQAIDQMLGKDSNIKLLKADMEAKFKKTPAAFFFKYIAPLIPKEMILKHIGENAPGGIKFTINQVVREVVIEDGVVTSVTELPVADAQPPPKMIDQPLTGDNGKAE